MVGDRNYSTRSLEGFPGLVLIIRSSGYATNSDLTMAAGGYASELAAIAAIVNNNIIKIVKL